MIWKCNGRSKKTELEKTLDQALSNENWGASGTMLNDLAQASYNEYGVMRRLWVCSADYRVISEAIWKTLAVQPKYWKQIFKVRFILPDLAYVLGSEPDWPSDP